MQGEWLRSAVDRALSPTFFREFGVVWRGDYAWVEPGQLVARRMIRFQPLKGLAAVFFWGLSLSFVPKAYGSRLVYHRTAKSARLDVFEWPRSWFSKEFLHIDCLPERFERSLARYLPTVMPDMSAWFRQVSSLGAIETELRRQIESTNIEYRMHDPSPAAVLEFVVAHRVPDSLT